jgi:hypothetical protein
MAKREPPTDEMFARIHPWWRVAYEFGHLNGSWFAIKRGTEEYTAWQRYFEKLGWFPRIWNGQQVTMPCQWPEWLPPIPTQDKPKPRFSVVPGGRDDG